MKVKVSESDCLNIRVFARELLGVAEPLLEKKLHPTLIVSLAR